MQTLKQIVILLTGLIFGLSAYAQVIPAPLSLSASPASPPPGTTFAVSAATPTFDKDAAIFSWTVDGKTRPDFFGQGKNEITLTAGDAGTQMRISVSVSYPGGGGEASLIVRPSGLSLAWFAETSVPRWYRGKALATPSSVVNIVAVPEFVIDGKRISPDNLIYRWSLDDQTNALVGAGKQVFRIKTSDIPKTTHQVEVTVEDIDRKIRKEARLIVAPTAPRAAIYSSTPLGGVEFRTAAVSATVKKGLYDFVAEPFFFPTLSRQDITTIWDIAGAAIQNSFSSPFLATIDTSGLPQGTTPVTVRISYAKGLIPQSASQTLNLFVQ